MFCRTKRLEREYASAGEWQKLSPSSLSEKIADYAVPSAATIFSALGAYFVNSAWDSGWTVLGFVLIAVSLISVPAAKAWVAHRRALSEQNTMKNFIKFVNNIGDFIEPIAGPVSTISSEEEVSRYIMEMLRVARHLFPESEYRVCLYTLEKRAPRDEVDTNPQTYLQLFAYKGRKDHPRHVFLPTEPNGDQTIEIAQGHVGRCFRNIGTYYKDNKIDHPTGSAWEAFMQFPIISSSNKNIGSLMIDCTENVVWNEYHHHVGSLVASALARGLEMLPEGAAVERSVFYNLKKIIQESPASLPDSRRQSHRMKEES